MEHGDKAAMDHDGMTGMQHNGASPGSAAPRHTARSSARPWTCSQSNRCPGLMIRGVGLRNNGRRVLTYADLHTLGAQLIAVSLAARLSCI